MDDVDKFYMLEAMGVYGGGFASALASAWYRADSSNTARLEKAFPELVKEYGRGSKFFNAIEAKHDAS